MLVGERRGTEWYLERETVGYWLLWGTLLLPFGPDATAHIHKRPCWIPFISFDNRVWIQIFFGYWLLWGTLLPLKQGAAAHTQDTILVTS